MGKVRQSNIELLRIISIILIMVVHANYMTFGFPVLEEIKQEPFKNFLYIGVENISIICVDVFVLISGWFGIHAKLKTILGFIFQSIFFALIVQIFFKATNITPIETTGSLIDLITFLPFVNCYIVLYILSPVLNAFVETASKSQFSKLLLAFYSWLFIMGWLFMRQYDLYAGKTTLCFIGLYLLARFIRIHVKFHPKIDNAYFFGGIWLTYILLLISVEVICALTGYTDKICNLLVNMTMSYSSPNVIFASVIILLFFSRLDIKSKVINWIAASAFACVLLHGQMEVEFYCPLLKSLYLSNSLPLFLLKTTGVMAAFFFIGIILDKIRIVIWETIVSKLDYLKTT